ncbi:MAG: TetR/AcrR family transcriptional regulator [Alphaproteobacteria bacterium]|jgi:AcrR family transcriptional regulator|nr:TetR/AcrR family transcriptional regulator [Alphaproteobacteria bacterium]MDP6831146.1 TetR/AcrR family transcriptional regulator [Alphaproteobacteria bacterium]
MKDVAIDRRADRKKRRIHKRQNEILDSAKQHFLARHYKSVTIEDIAEEALVSRATIYSYFKNKNELYGAVVLRDTETLTGSIMAALETGASLADNLRRATNAYMDFFGEHPEYFRELSFHYFPGRQEKLPADIAARIDEKLAMAMARIQHCIEDGIANGEARPVDARAAALALWGHWMGYAHITIIGYARKFGSTEEKIFRTGADAFLSGLITPSTDVEE